MLVPLRSQLLPLTLAAFLVGCSHWTTIEPPWAEALAESHQEKVRITLADTCDDCITSETSEIIVFSPMVERDTLTGLRDGTDYSVPLSQVRKLDGRGADAKGIVGLTVGILAVAVAIAGIIFAATFECCFSTTP